MVDERESSVPVPRTFLVWSWLALLGAYGGTMLAFTTGLWFPGGFLQRLGPLAGHDVPVVFLLIAVLGTVLPVVLLSLGSVRLFRYSVEVYEVTTAAPTPGGVRDTAVPFFRQALGYLLTTWIVVLALQTLPLLLSVFLSGTSRR